MSKGTASFGGLVLFCEDRVVYLPFPGPAVLQHLLRVSMELSTGARTPCVVSVWWGGGVSKCILQGAVRGLWLETAWRWGGVGEKEPEGRSTCPS